MTCVVGLNGSNESFEFFGVVIGGVFCTKVDDVDLNFVRFGLDWIGLDWIGLELELDWNWIGIGIGIGKQIERIMMIN